jgi:hypothetical protein
MAWVLPDREVLHHCGGSVLRSGWLAECSLSLAVGRAWRVECLFVRRFLSWPRFRFSLKHAALYLQWMLSP